MSIIIFFIIIIIVTIIIVDCVFTANSTLPRVHLSVHDMCTTRVPSMHSRKKNIICWFRLSSLLYLFWVTSGLSCSFENAQMNPCFFLFPRLYSKWLRSSALHLGPIKLSPIFSTLFQLISWIFFVSISYMTPQCQTFRFLNKNKSIWKTPFIVSIMVRVLLVDELIVTLFRPLSWKYFCK